jgi:GntR family transcriptional regulator, rspAB operon transcriptional repressor
MSHPTSAHLETSAELPTVKFSPLVKKHLPLDAAIADALLNDILDRRYPAGAWIKEQDVADRFQVSRSPVREAFRQVASLGFVVVRPWRGAQVIDLSIDETEQIFELLEVVYGVIARQATRKLTHEDHLDLANILEPAIESVAAGANNEGIRAAFFFGLQMARRGASRSSYELILRVGRLALWQNQLLEAEGDDYTRPAGDILRSLLAAIVARDANSAEALARVSVSFARTALLNRLRKRESNIDLPETQTNLDTSD